MSLESLGLKSETAKRVRDDSLDFKGIQAGKGVNAIHSYPAMFHPHLVRRVIESCSNGKDLVLDPFLGSGVAAVESSILGRQFAGFDINPLAVLIAKVRTTPIERDILEKSLIEILERSKNIEAYLPKFPNMDFWFSEARISSISKILKSINFVSDDKVQRFYKVALSETIRAISRTKPNEFKLVRRKIPCSLKTDLVFTNYAKKNIHALAEFYANKKIEFTPRIERKNVLTDDLQLKDDCVSLLITSPPYGDSQTTVAYGQFSRLSLQWLGLPCWYDKESLGAKATLIKHDLPSERLYDALKVISKKDNRRAMQVYSFYKDLFYSLIKLVPKVKNRGYLVFVVGNRTVKGVELPTDLICAEMLQHLSCTHLETRIRLIGNKRMPSKNSPTNIRGKKSPTMRYEYVVICRRNR